jgi:hypothetical protein
LSGSKRRKKNIRKNEDEIANSIVIVLLLLVQKKAEPCEAAEVRLNQPDSERKIEELAPQPEASFRPGLNSGAMG